jgi:hypothetical protein
MVSLPMSPEVGALFFTMLMAGVFYLGRHFGYRDGIGEGVAATIEYFQDQGVIDIEYEEEEEYDDEEDNY